MISLVKLVTSLEVSCSDVIAKNAVAAAAQTDWENSRRIDQPSIMALETVGDGWGDWLMLCRNSAVTFLCT